MAHGASAEMPMATQAWRVPAASVAGTWWAEAAGAWAFGVLRTCMAAMRGALSAWMWPVRPTGVRAGTHAWLVGTGQTSGDDGEDLDSESAALAGLAVCRCTVVGSHVSPAARVAR